MDFLLLLKAVMILTGIRTLNFIFLLLFLFLFFLLQAVMNLTTGIRTLNFNNDGQMLLMASQAKKEALRYSKFTRDFTCFTGTKVQILTLRTLRILHTATSLLVQKYKY
jgi:hypothetical protein